MGYPIRTAGILVSLFGLLSASLAADVVVEGTAPIRNGDVGQARELALRRALAQAAEGQSASVTSQTVLRNGVLHETTQLSSRACTENAEIVGERVDHNNLTLRVAVSVRESGACQASCRQTTTNRVVVTGFPLEHPEQILPSEDSWLTNWTPVELARFIEQRRQLLVAHDATAFPYASAARVPEPHFTPAAATNPFASLAARHRAQYVIAGVYRDFGLRHRSFSGNARHMEIEVFIHDAVNGTVLDRKTFSDAAEGQVGLRSKPSVGTAEFYASDLGRVWGRILSEIAGWVTERVSCLPFAARVLKVEGDSIYLDAGAESGLSAGDTLLLHTWRRPPNPVRGEDGRVLGEEKFSRAAVSIRSPYPAFSIAEMLEGGQGVKISPGDVLYAK